MWHRMRHALEEKAEREMPTTVIVKRLLSLLSPYKKHLLGVIILITISSITSLYAPYVLGRAIDHYIVRGDLNGLIIMGTIYLTLNIAQWLSNSLRYYLTQLVGQKFVNKLRRTIFDKLMNLSFSFYNRSRSGDLISIAVNDTSVIQEVLVSDIFSVLGDSMALIGIVVAMFMLNAKLAAITLSFTPIIALFARKFGSKFRRAYREAREKIAMVTRKVQESISGIRVVKAFGREDIFSRNFQSASAEVLQANIRAGKLMAVFWPMIRMLSVLVTVTVLWYGGYLSSLKEVTIGTLVAFLAYVNRLMNPIMMLVNVYGSLQSALAASERVFKVLDEELEIKDSPDAIELDKVKGEIEYRNVYFEYIPGNPVLKNINLKIRPGEKIAIVGPTGAGKTTMVYLLCRFYDVKSGAILVDGLDVRKIKQKSLRKNIGFVPQDTYLFPGSIMENIKVAKPNATNEEVIEVCKKLGIHEFIMRLPNGYETDAGEAGKLLSTGEKQLISFARAMLKNPPILILDEAISSVDLETEQMIINAIRKLLENRTAIIIAHRLTLARSCDKIIVLVNGEIVEEGSHEELMKKKGIYYNLYTSQIGVHEIKATA